VGITMVGSAEAVRAGMRGKLLRITHYYRDSLWGFLSDLVVVPGCAGRSSAFTRIRSRLFHPSHLPLPTPTHHATCQTGAFCQTWLCLPVMPGCAARSPALTRIRSCLFHPLSSTPTHHAHRETAEGSYVPNKGFLPDLVVPDPDAAPASSEGAAPEDSPEDSTDDSTLNPGGGEGGQGGMRVGVMRGERQLALTPAQMDELLDRCLLQALSVSVKPAHLPLGASTLWSNHVLPCRPPGTTVDIKKSSHKKLSKWLHAKAVDGLVSAGEIYTLTCVFNRMSHERLSKWLHAKAVDGLISSKEDKHRKEFSLSISGKEDKHRKEFILSAINYRHPTLIAFTPEKTNKPAQTPAAATLDASRAAPGAPTTTTATTTTTSNGSGSSSSGGGLTVEEVFKPTHHVSAIFEAVGLDPHAYYSPSAAREAALSYISLHSLTKPSDPSVVILDAPLCDALYKGAIKKGAAYPTECHKRDVGPTIVKRIQAHHRVERAGKSVVRKGGLVPVQILVERRQGNKKVTRVSGLEAYLVEAEPLAAELQRKFASSTSVAEVPGKKGQQEVLIQGGVLDVHVLPLHPLCPPSPPPCTHARSRQEGAARGADSGRGIG
ncbi:unnamed protein product, partial [Closterium sp. Naga37s-1]